LKADFKKNAADCSCKNADINQDDKVTIKDLGIMMSEWK
jgi:hypothetical protein